jgi:four helix bundle protein
MAESQTAYDRNLRRVQQFSILEGLRDQIRRASVSIMANIAEGFGRSGSAEFQQYLAIAKGSVCEVISHM